MSYRKQRAEATFVTEGNNVSKIFGTPIYIDTADTENIYLGYGRINEELDKDTELLIKKINVNGDIITMYYAYGEWANRATLQYK